MQRFIMMIGPSGSGKSTYAASLASAMKTIGEDVIVLSSDNIREELYGDANDQQNPAQVFRLMNERTYSAIMEGRSVIYDATNLIRERRVEMLKKIDSLRPNVCFDAYWFTPSVDECIQRQSMRDRHVPTRVVERQYRQLQAPNYDEGWNSIERI